MGAALVAGLIAGALIGAAEWFALRKWVSWLWIPATTAEWPWAWLRSGSSRYGIDRGDVVLMGAVTGLE